MLIIRMRMVLMIVMMIVIKRLLCFIVIQKCNNKKSEIHLFAASVLATNRDYDDCYKKIIMIHCDSNW